MGNNILAAVSPLVALLALGILASNSFVLVIFARYKFIRVPQNVFIFTLCVADLFVGLNLPVQLALNFRPDLLQNSYLCAYKHACVILPIAVSLMDLAVISLDRLVSIVYALRYESIVTMRRTVRISIVMWIYNIIVFFVVIMLWHTNSKNPNIQCTPRILTKGFAIFIISTHAVILVLTIVVCYIIIFSIAFKKLNNSCTPLQGPISSETRKLQRHFKTAKTAVVVLGSLFVAWLPNTAMYVVIILREDPPTSVLNQIVQVTMYLPPLHSLLNPFLYTLRLRDFRSAAKHLRQRVRAEPRPYVIETSGASPGNP